MRLIKLRQLIAQEGLFEPDIEGESLILRINQEITAEISLVSQSPST